MWTPIWTYLDCEGIFVILLGIFTSNALDERSNRCFVWFRDQKSPSGRGAETRTLNCHVSVKSLWKIKSWLIRGIEVVLVVFVKFCHYLWLNCLFSQSKHSLSLRSLRFVASIWIQLELDSSVCCLRPPQCYGSVCSRRPPQCYCQLCWTTLPRNVTHH